MPGRHSLLTHTDKFSILSDEGGEVRGGEVFYWNILYPYPNASNFSNLLFIHAKLLLTSSDFHMATVSVRQIQTAMSNRHFLGTP